MSQRSFEMFPVRLFFNNVTIQSRQQTAIVSLHLRIFREHWSSGCVSPLYFIFHFSYVPYSTTRGRTRTANTQDDILPLALFLEILKIRHFFPFNRLDALKMSGQSITDRITAAQHSVTGSAVSKTVCKATTHEIMGPKKKHLDCKYLLELTS